MALPSGEPAEVTTDVAIVGGGPAGSAAALWLARQGARVVVLERERFPRHRPGETLPPGVEPIFAQLGVAEAIEAAGFIRHRGTWVTWSGPRRFDPFGADDDGPWLGFQAPREIFDSILLRAAIDAGAVVRQPCRALHPLQENGRVVGVQTTLGPIRTSWLIDAGGNSHWLARRLRIPLQYASPRLLVRYGYVAGRCSERDEAPEIVADATGWSWSARIAPDRYQWTRLSWTDDDPRRDRPSPELAGLSRDGRSRGADVTWRLVARPAGPGYLCVGDAAAVLDPASSHGVLKGLMSGMMAGHVLLQALAGTATEEAAMRAFTDWIGALFTAEVTALVGLYRQLPQPPAWVRQLAGDGSSVFRKYAPVLE